MNNVGRKLKYSSIKSLKIVLKYSTWVNVLSYFTPLVKCLLHLANILTIHRRTLDVEKVINKYILSIIKSDARKGLDRCEKRAVAN